MTRKPTAKKPAAKKPAAKKPAAKTASSTFFVVGASDGWWAAEGTEEFRSLDEAIEAVENDAKMVREDSQTRIFEVIDHGKFVTTVTTTAKTTRAKG